MDKIEKITAKDIMSATIKSIDKNETLNKAVSILINNHIHNLVVFENDKYAGIFGYKQLAKLHRRPEQSTKLANFISKPPVIAEDTGILDLVEQMYLLNYKMMPIGDEAKITGIVTEHDILNAIVTSGLLTGKKAKDFMTPDPLILHENDSLGKAFSLFRRNNISRILIIDNNKKLTGILESLDLIREMTSKEQYGRDSGASSSSGYIQPGAYISDIISEYEISIKSLMSTTPVSASPDDLLTGKIEESLNLGISTIAIIDKNSYPTGIIAPKDIIHFLVSLKEKQELQIQVSGIESIKTITDFEKSEILKIAERTINKISNISESRNFAIHAKAYNQESNKTTYTFRCKLNTASGTLFAKTHGFDPIDTFSTLADEIEKLFIKKSKKQKDNIRSNIRDAKYSI
ncbi:MAG: hypothetical protein DRN71_05110 [Candidatus Nanohalarchaeota archaeon]|nr:MAG: hypothetical protein DRN71_05110 [Candidatus Nanohaloarchaeota archaeon]